MKRSVKILSAPAVMLSIFLAGCYTILMTPEEYLSSRNEQPVIWMDNSSDITYSNNCLSCHSRSELDDRHLDMKSYGITTAHGFIIDPSMWIAAIDPINEPPYFPPGPTVPIPPWWLPPPVIVVGDPGQNQRSAKEPKKKRADNPSRGTDTENVREHPTTTYTNPSPRTPETTPAPVSTSPPATTVAPQPSSPPPQSTSKPESSGAKNSGSSSSPPPPTKKRSD